MQTGDLAISGAGLLLVVLLCVRLAARRPDLRQVPSLQEPDKKEQDTLNR